MRAVHERIGVAVGDDLLGTEGVRHPGPVHLRVHGAGTGGYEGVQLHLGLQRVREHLGRRLLVFLGDGLLQVARGGSVVRIAPH
eukprot:8172057-Lingulodinium_polyedra.AAC.1